MREHLDPDQSETVSFVGDFHLHLPPRLVHRRAHRPSRDLPVVHLPINSQAAPNAAVNIPGSPPATPQPLERDDESARIDLEDAANNLMAELRVWDQASNFTPLHPRVQYGNHCYRHAMRIAVLRDVFQVREDDPRVRASASAIVELCKELAALSSRINW